MYYFAYGSKMSHEQMTKRCPGSSFLKRAYLKHYKFIYDGYSEKWGCAVANIKKDICGKVWGCLFEITDEDLKELDEYEGYPRIYQREELEVEDDSGYVHKAIVYLRTGQKSGKPTEEYMRTVIDGAWDCKLPEKYIVSLRNVKGMFYEMGLMNQLEGVIDSYQEEHEGFWDLKEDYVGGMQDLDYDKAENFAKAILKGTEKLISPDECDYDDSYFKNKWDENAELEQRLNEKWVDIAKSNLPDKEKKEAILKLLMQYPVKPESEKSPLRVIWELFAIKMSWESVSKIQDGANRIFSLYRLVRSCKPSEPTQEFLSRLSRCYVWGFDPECIILCRAVIDNAFRDVISDQMCEKYFGSRYSKSFNLVNRIQAAEKEELIDKSIKDIAHRIRERGNKAIHYQPDITKQVWETICNTVTVLGALYKSTI